MSLRKIIIIALCFFAFISTSCDLLNNDDECDLGYKPYDCIETEPDNGTLKIDITLNSLNSSVPVTIYVGDYEDNHIYLQDTLVNSAKTYYLPNNDYAAKADYNDIIEGSEITVFSIDGGDLSADSEEYCDGTCYSEGYLTLDVTYK